MATFSKSGVWDKVPWESTLSNFYMTYNEVNMILGINSKDKLIAVVFAINAHTHTHTHTHNRLTAFGPGLPG